MIDATTLKSDVQGEFEGGNSLSVNWDTLIRRAVENVMDNCRPETLKRRVPIYGGIAQNLHTYYCPDDVLVPAELYDSEGQMLYGDEGARKWKYRPAKQFYKKEENNTYTIEYINGVRFIVVRHSSTKSILTVDTMDALGTISGGSAVLNEHNFITGTGAIEATVTDAGTEIGDTLSTALDISDYLRGVGLVPIYLPTKKNIASIELRLKTDDSNYHSVISTADSIGDYLTDGWNMVRFNLANRTEVGTPTDTNMAKWSVVVTTESGETETIVIDKITIHKTAVFYLEYYSNKMFVNATTKAWQDTLSVDDEDTIRLDRDVSGILHYELCLLVVQAATYDSIDSQASKRFEGQLERKYNAYWAIHPSSEAPPSYSKSPEIDLASDLDGVALQDDTIVDD